MKKQFILVAAAVSALSAGAIGPEAAKACYFGRGEHSLLITASTGRDLEGLDNLTWGLRYDGERPDAASAIAAIAEADPRVTLSDGSIAVDLDADGVITSADFILGTTEGTPTAYGYRFGAEPEHYLFYMPEPGVTGIFLPETINVALADVKPVVGTLFQVAEGDSVGSSWTVYRVSTPEATSGTDATVFSAAQRVSGTRNAMLTFKGAAGKTYVKIRLQKIEVADGKTTRSYFYSNPCEINVAEPEIPITSIRLSVAEIEAKLSHKVPYVIALEPADATYTGLTFATDNRSVATVNATTGAVSTTKTAGTAVITVAYAFNPEVSATLRVESALRQPVSDISFEGADSDGVITLTPKQMLGLFPVFNPADPDIQDVTMTLSGNGTGKDNYIATMYQVNITDGDGNRLRPYELSGHRAGECKLTVKAGDGSGVEREFAVRVVEQDRDEVRDYGTGTIILNEEWFGHTNGGLNWIDENYGVHYQAYERENQGMSFGATSQYGIIYEGKLIVCSKQAVDNGDPLPGGGRIVVADARTLKRIGSVDELKVDADSRSMDGRACVGAGPGKVYVGTNAGIFILDTENVAVTGMVGGTEGDAVSGDLYKGQIGDMILVGKTVYALCQDKGVILVDTTTDTVKHTIDDKGVQGICQSSDGNVWYVTNHGDHSDLVSLAPETADEIAREHLPAEIGRVSCGWGAWRSTQFTSAKKRNELWFCPGSSISNGGSGVVYRWEIGSPVDNIEPFFNVNELHGVTPGRTQSAYGTIRFDDRTDEIIVMSCENGSSGHYRYHWVHFINGETGEINHTIALRPYYWFQAHAIFPDVELPRFVSGGIEVGMARSAGDEFELKSLVADPDNIDYNISVTPEAAVGDNEFFSYSVTDGGLLHITPKAVGSAPIPFELESNGRKCRAQLTVTVNGGVQTAIDSAVNAGGDRMDVYDASGTLVARGIPADEIAKLPRGIYVARGVKFLLK